MTKTLSEFISEIGDHEAAVLFGVAHRTIQSWRRGERKPKTSKAKFIIDKTNGVVTYEGIYQSE